jgi:hypothetical protein
VCGHRNTNEEKTLIKHYFCPMDKRKRKQARKGEEANKSQDER